MSKRKVVRARFHDISLVITGYGTFEKELPVSNLKTGNKAAAVFMEEGEHGLEVHLPGISTAIVIPYPNVQIYFLEPTITIKK